MAKQVMRGYPDDKDPLKSAEELEEELDGDKSGDDDNEDGDDEDQNPPPPQKETVEERLARLEGENAVLRATITRAPPQEQKKKDPEPEPDWEKLMYDDPKEYTKQLSAKIRREVEGEVVGKYQKDQGEKEFWNEFYHENDDLVEDKDLVRTILSNNINLLGDMPVSQAKKKLADLTRERIMRYTGKQKKDKDEGDHRVRVEGARSPKTPEKKDDDTKIVTLSDIIRSRRANRMKARSA